MNNDEKIKSHNKLYIFLKIALTTIFSFTMFLDSSLIFVQNLRALSNEIFFSKITVKNIIVFVITWLITFLVLTIFEFVIKKIEGEIYKKDENAETHINKPKSSIKLFFMIFGIILLMWMPYVLSYFPGGLFSDTLVSIQQCFHYIPYNNSNPIVYTLLIKVFLTIGAMVHNYQIGIDIFGMTQVVVMAGILSYFVCWLYKKNFSNLVLTLVVLFFFFFKLIPMYAISLWKDVPFCLALFLYIIKTIDIIYNSGEILKDKKEIAKYIILLFVVSFLRNNGLYIVLAMTLIIVICYYKKKIYKFAISSLIAFILIFAIRGPIFTKIGINSSSSGGPATGGWNAIMISQIFYTSVRDGNITPEQNELINKMCEINKLKEVYAPLLLDATTINPEFNNQYIVDYYSSIKKLWFELLLQNPTKYVESYLLSTLGFWDVNKAFPDAYVSNFMWPTTPTVFGVQQTDWIEKLTGQSIIDKIQVTKLYSSAIFLFIMLASMIFTVYKKNYKNLLMYLPALFTWGTIMLATPIAFSLRYVYILVLMIPLDFIIPFLSNEKNK